MCPPERSIILHFTFTVAHRPVYRETVTKAISVEYEGLVKTKCEEGQGHGHIRSCHHWLLELEGGSETYCRAYFRAKISGLQRAQMAGQVGLDLSSSPLGSCVPRAAWGLVIQTQGEDRL